MKIRILPLLTLCILLSSPSALAGILDGAWQLVSGEYLDEQGKLVSYEKTGMQSLKVLSGNHFSFTSMKNSQFWAAGSGTFEIKDDKYVETLLFNSFAEKPGASFSFTTLIVGDIWYNSRWKDGVRIEYEVWHKISE
ncbi:hypothetical protein [Neptunicella sp. SCSIO 80796]|uniref:hypothetical protein n=1 Tax=Neptunicella plasticusilytica TaxID=3117012 RepID=UPI003A4E3C5F